MRPFKGRDIISTEDMTREEIEKVLDVAKSMETILKSGKPYRVPVSCVDCGDVATMFIRVRKGLRPRKLPVCEDHFQDRKRRKEVLQYKRLNK